LLFAIQQAICAIVSIASVTLDTFIPRQRQTQKYKNSKLQKKLADRKLKKNRKNKTKKVKEFNEQ